MSKKPLVFGILLAISTNVQAFAAEGQGNPALKHQGPLMQMRGDLSLDQQKQFDEIMRASNAEIKPLVKQIEELRAKQTDGSAPAPAIAELEAKLRAKRKAAHQKLVSLLTLDQKAKFEELRAKRLKESGESK